jgi:hypothetical protein
VSKTRLVITAVLVEGRSVGDVSAAYGVARSWIYELLARYRTEGDDAFEPRSRRPHASPSALPTGTTDLIIQLRRQLAGQGLDAGAHTIAWHLAEQHQLRVSAATEVVNLCCVNRVVDLAWVVGGWFASSWVESFDHEDAEVVAPVGGRGSSCFDGVPVLAAVKPGPPSRAWSMG